MEHDIIFASELEGAFPYEALLRTCITTALEAEQVTLPCEINVLITDDPGIHQINLEQRQVDRPTDVLSFPMFELTPGEPGYLAVHSVLHLLGYDHMDEGEQKARMRRREEAIMNQGGMPRT